MTRRLLAIDRFVETKRIPPKLARKVGGCWGAGWGVGCPPGGPAKGWRASAGVPHGPTITILTRSYVVC